MAQVDPHRHACGPHDIDYSQATGEKAVIRCKVCPRYWTPTQYGWKPHPVSRWKPK